MTDIVSNDLSTGVATGVSGNIANRIRLPLFFLRASLFIVYLAWTWDKLFNPGHGAGIMNRHYSLDFITPEMVFALGFIEFVFILALLLGLLKRPVRALVIVLSLISAFGPMIRGGYIVFLQAPDGGRLDAVSGLFLPYSLMPTLCMVVASIVIYAMRDYDTLWSFSKKDRALNA